MKLFAQLLRLNNVDSIFLIAHKSDVILSSLIRLLLRDPILIGKESYALFIIYEGRDFI